MLNYRKLRSLLCVFALALAACGGGGGPGSMTNPEADQRLAISTAIQEASTAVGDLDAMSTNADVSAAEEAIAAARTAVTDADALGDTEKQLHRDAISRLEDDLAPARSRIAMARAEEAAGLLVSFDGPGIGDIGATIRHGAAPVMAGTVLDTPPVSVRGLATAAAGSPVTVGTWTGGAWTASDEMVSIRDRIVLYTDIAEPGTRPFRGNGGKYDETNGLDEDGNLPIGDTTDATLIVSSAFPTTAGIREHSGGSGGEVRLAGMFDGAQGAYACTPAAESPCTSSVRHGGGIALAGGEAGWKFLPTEGATVSDPDAAYRYFGWWLRETNSDRFIAAFHAGVGNADDGFLPLAVLQGEARYRGPAAGVAVVGGDDGPVRAEEFTAMVALTAEFGDEVNPGTVGGTVEAFLVDGESRPWSVALRPAAIHTDGTIEADSVNTAHTAWTIEGMQGPASANARTWRGQFHEAGADRVPSAATGTFEADFGNQHRMIGAFGATRRP